jgi:hypothetical protein
VALLHELSDGREGFFDIADRSVAYLWSEPPPGLSGLRINFVGILAEAGDHDYPLPSQRRRQSVDETDVVADPIRHNLRRRLRAHAPPPAGFRAPCRSNRVTDVAKRSFGLFRMGTISKIP